MQRIILPNEYMKVLRRIARSGREDLLNLAESLRLDPRRVKHIVRALQHKGLVIVSGAIDSDGWLQLSSKGRRLLDKLQPQLRPGYPS